MFDNLRLDQDIMNERQYPRNLDQIDLSVSDSEKECLSKLKLLPTRGVSAEGIRAEEAEAVRIGADGFLSIAYWYIGEAYRQAGSPAEALRCYATSHSLFDKGAVESGGKYLYIRALIELSEAKASKDLSQYEDAFGHFEQAKQYLMRFQTYDQSFDYRGDAAVVEARDGMAECEGRGNDPISQTAAAAGLGGRETQYLRMREAVEDPAGSSITGFSEFCDAMRLRAYRISPTGASEAMLIVANSWPDKFYSKATAMFLSFDASGRSFQLKSEGTVFLEPSVSSTYEYSAVEYFNEDNPDIETLVDADGFLAFAVRDDACPNPFSVGRVERAIALIQKALYSFVAEQIRIGLVKSVNPEWEARSIEFSKARNDRVLGTFYAFTVREGGVGEPCYVNDHVNYDNAEGFSDGGIASINLDTSPSVAAMPGQTTLIEIGVSGSSDTFIGSTFMLRKSISEVIGVFHPIDVGSSARKTGSIFL